MTIDRNKTYIDLIGFGEYAFVQNPTLNKFTKGMEYSVNIQVTDSGLAALVEAGLDEQVFNPSSNTMQSRFKDHKTLGYKQLTLRKKVHKYERDGQTLETTLYVTDAEGEDTTAIPGNGSLLKVTAEVEDIVKDGKASGRKVTLGRVQILELVPFESKVTSMSSEELDAAKAEATAAIKSQIAG